MGIALAAFLAVDVSPTWLLFLITSFLGGLTTFSTLSAEAFLLLQQGQNGAAAVHIGAHVAGSFACTALGSVAERGLTP